MKLVKVGDKVKRKSAAGAKAKKLLIVKKVIHYCIPRIVPNSDPEETVYYGDEVSQGPLTDETCVYFTNGYWAYGDQIVIVE
jgi:hypothetical protein